MTARDEELRRLLQKWEAPPPGRTLDARVWSSYRLSNRTSRRKSWVPIAAGLILAVGLAALWPTASGRNLETSMEADGFRPLPNGAITVIKTSGAQTTRAKSTGAER